MNTGLNPGGVPLNASMPAAVIIPEIAYDDVNEAVEWLYQASGIPERLRIGNLRSQLTYGAGAIIIKEKEEIPGMDLQAIEDVQGRSDLMVRIPDVDQHYEQARKWGARIVKRPADYPYGERQYIAEDLGGNRWMFSETLSDVDPETWGCVLIDS